MHKRESSSLTCSGTGQQSPRIERGSLGRRDARASLESRETKRTVQNGSTRMSAYHTL